MLVKCGGKGTLISCWWERKLIQPLWKTIWNLLRKLKIELPYVPSIPLLGIYLKGCESGYNKVTYTTCTTLFFLTTVHLYDQEQVKEI
jgi:hypothetical protein